MNGKGTEVFASFVTVIGVAGAILWPFSHERASVRKGRSADVRIVTLTGVAEDGVWTDQEVHGGDYWFRDYRAARPVLRVGQETVLRLKSADVIHTFYCPELGIGPIEVYPGHLKEITFTPSKKGVFASYCTTICGDPHFGMRGEIVVVEEGETPPPPSETETEAYWLEPPPKAGASRAEHGKWLFKKHGCFQCHGPEGKGGVTNYNSPGRFVPALDILAEKLEFWGPEDAQTIISLIEKGEDPGSLAPPPKIENADGVLNRFREIQKLIRDGSVMTKKDPEGPAPPLDMPAWKDRLSDSDVDAIIAYLLSLQSWE